MSKTLTAQEQPLYRVFSSDYSFSIPGYQRPYSWTKDQIRDMFEDLTTSIDAQAVEVADLPPYFLGSVVLIKSTDAPSSDVVDGQQRLTTLTLLLSALRANMPQPQAAEVTEFVYEKGSKIGGKKDDYRLTLRPLESVQDQFER